MTDEAQRRVKAADLPPPRRVGADDFARIVRRFQIPDERRPELREFLDGLTNEFAAIIARERSQPDRRADRGHIDKARKAIAKAQYEIKLAGGPAAAAALRRAAGCIGEMISASWTRKLFPHDNLVPSLHYEPLDPYFRRAVVRNTPARVPMRHVSIDDLSPDERVYFAKHRSRELIAAIFDTLDTALSDGRLRIVKPREGAKKLGGPKPLTQRRYLLANLARHWHRLGGLREEARDQNFPPSLRRSVTRSAGRPMASKPICPRQ